MANKTDALIDKVLQLAIGLLQCDQVLRGDGWVEVTWINARVLGQIVHHLAVQIHKESEQGMSMSLAIAHGCHMHAGHAIQNGIGIFEKFKNLKGQRKDSRQFLRFQAKNDVFTSYSS